MNIYGVGFDTLRTTVYAAGVQASIQTISANFITALIPAFPSTYTVNATSGFNKFYGGAGLRWTVYDVA